MKIRQNAIICSLTILSLILYPQHTNAFYSDVNEDYKYYEAIKVLYELDKLPLTDTFEPQKKLSREEFYQILLEFKQTELDSSSSLPFQDTTTTSEFTPYLAKALDLQIIRPGSKNFAPKQLISRYNSLNKLFLHLGIGVDYFFPRESFPFKDISASSFAAPVAYKAFELGIIQDERFNSAYRITKGELANMLYKIDEHKSYSSYIQPHSIKTTTQINSELEKNAKYPILESSYNTIKNQYYYKEDIDESELIYNAIKGMLRGLEDPYTTFESPSDAEAFRDQLSGEYEGIGVVIELIDDQLTIVSPLKDSPAEQAGLKAKDIILEADGVDLSDKNLAEASTFIKGPAGSKLELKIKRKSQIISIEVERGFIIYSSINSEIINESGSKIGYINILSFNESAGKDFKEELQSLKTQNLQGYIIDLRNNPGGFVDTALEIMNTFSKEELDAMKIKYSSGYEETYKTNGSGEIANEKLVILINSGSASASEILAGFIQDHKLGTIIGTQSFGKGSVQQINNYKDNSLLKYTAAKWFTPLGEEIDEKGITPDIIIENSEQEDEQLEAAIREI